MSRKAWIVGAAVVLLSTPGFARADEKLDPEATTGTTPFAEDHLENYTTGMLIGYLEIFQRGTDAASQERAAKIASHLSQTDANWRVSAAAAAAFANGTSTAVRTSRASRKLKRDDSPTPTPTPTPTRRTVATSGGSSGNSGGTVVATSGGSSGGSTVVTPTPTASAAPLAPVSFVADEGRQEEIPNATPPPSPTPITVATRRTDWFAAAQDQMQSFWEAGRDVPGAAPKGKIYDPATGQLVSLDEHTGKVGVDQAFDDELSNTSSGAGAGTMKRITDK